MDPIVFEENPSRADVDALKTAIDEFNYAATGHRDGRWLTAFVRDAAGAMIAGISGFTWGGYAKVEYLWVAEPHRRNGIGKRLLAAAEAEARTRGCAQIILDTHDFQAPHFYAKQGYVSAGRIEGAPRHSAQTWFRKPL
jgi:GNAT superfamily N-acetyltransferase